MEPFKTDEFHQTGLSETVACKLLLSIKSPLKLDFSPVSSANYRSQGGVGTLYLTVRIRLDCFEYSYF